SHQSGSDLSHVQASTLSLCAASAAGLVSAASRGTERSTLQNRKIKRSNCLPVSQLSQQFRSHVRCLLSIGPSLPRRATPLIDSRLPPPV
ncbi:hypothetical protein PENTCL1PPCAC_27281, partial [Pristionchus entomophagus]